VVRLKRLAVGLALVGLVGCGNAGDLVASDAEPNDTSKTQPSEDVASVPDRGDCRRLRKPDIDPPTNDDRTVPCDRRHTAFTYYVGEWPRRLLRSAEGVDDPNLKQYVFNKCDRSWQRTVGGSMEDWVVSIVSWAWYRPSAEQFNAGANWFRCDLVAGENTERLERLPTDVQGMLDGSFEDRYRACWTKVFSDKSGVDEGTLTSCAREHRQRAIGIVRIGTANEDYPGQQAAFDQSNNLCADAVSTWREAKQPGRFGLQWPRRDDWNDGQRYATCWAVTRN
jgi:Septum formation